VSLETIENSEHSHGRITVSDDGRGFCPAPDVQTAAASKVHRGLANMTMRAARCGARVDLTSSETGTRVQLDLPSRFPAADDVAG
jgi:signal transduction histidine kinase